MAEQRAAADAGLRPARLTARVSRLLKNAPSVHL